jgi:hypothetical protein
MINTVMLVNEDCRVEVWPSGEIPGMFCLYVENVESDSFVRLSLRELDDLGYELSSFAQRTATAVALQVQEKVLEERKR